jgi:hypothetical protein
LTQRDECRHAVQPEARDSPDAASRSTIELDLTQQRTVRRSRLFSLFPIALILTLIGNAAWEVVRTNTTGVRFSRWTDRRIFPCIFFLSGVVEPAEQQS